MVAVEPEVMALDAEIAAYLRLKNLTQAEFADELGMAPSTLSLKRRGLAEFTLSEVVAISQLIGKPVSELMKRN